MLSSMVRNSLSDIANILIPGVECCGMFYIQRAIPRTGIELRIYIYVLLVNAHATETDRLAHGAKFKIAIAILPFNICTTLNFAVSLAS